MKLNILGDGEHERGRLYQLEVDGESISVLLTAHALARSTRWNLTPVQVLRALLLPDGLSLPSAESSATRRQIKRSSVDRGYRPESV